MDGDTDDVGDSSAFALFGEMTGLGGAALARPMIAVREGGRERERKERSARAPVLDDIASGADIRRSTGILLEETVERGGMGGSNCLRTGSTCVDCTPGGIGWSLGPALGGHVKADMLLDCLPACISPEKPGELNPGLLPNEVPENIDEFEPRLSPCHHVELGVLLMRESNESLRSLRLSCAIPIL